MAKELRGVLAALCTPFDETGEHLAEAKLCAHIDRMIEAGVHGIVLCAGTGEFAFLREDEKRRIIELGTRHIDGRVAVIAQTSAVNTADAIERAKHAEGAGADALMILPPYFEGPGEAGTVKHYERIAAAVKTPIVLYNIPQVVGFEITPALFEQFLTLDNVEYVKDSKGDLVSQQELVATGGKVLSGADPIAPFAIMAGQRRLDLGRGQRHAARDGAALQPAGGGPPRRSAGPVAADGAAQHLFLVRRVQHAGEDGGEPARLRPGAGAGLGHAGDGAGARRTARPARAVRGPCRRRVSARQGASAGPGLGKGSD